MAASGTHPSQLHDIPSMSDYFKPLMEFMASLPPEKRVILVGHSMGGYCIPAAMESFPHKVLLLFFALLLCQALTSLSQHYLQRETRGTPFCHVGADAAAGTHRRLYVEDELGMKFKLRWRRRD
ncbi:hypothetical protein LWI28_019049 [Acer negundo]|uniref:Uncharacterized protein n=1 Tax=Acer negundo TaxID=4023 RepID=A0AAD5JPT1_ACENE|nr:hypothetical protein LWI28_019049 [Acer negundo]